MKVVGKFIDECKRQLMLRFIGLRPKYSFNFERDAHFLIDKNRVRVEVKKLMATSATKIVLDNTAKGVKADVVQKIV